MPSVSARRSTAKPHGADKRGEPNHVDVQIVSVLQIQAGISNACTAIELQRESLEQIGAHVEQLKTVQAADPEEHPLPSDSKPAID